MDRREKKEIEHWQQNYVKVSLRYRYDPVVGVVIALVQAMALAVSAGGGISSKPGKAGSIGPQLAARLVWTANFGVKISGSSRLEARTTTMPCIMELVEQVGDPHVGQMQRLTLLLASIGALKNLPSPVT